MLVLRNSDVMKFFKEGYVRTSEDYALSILERAFFMNRTSVENDEKYRQVIPYITLVHSGKILVLKRTAKQTEKRLHNRFTIGVGGHVNESDGNDPKEAFWNGMRRELNEEVDFEVERCVFSGVINSSESEVSRVHVGFHYVCFGRFKDVREKEKFEWRLVDLQELTNLEGMMEGWSKLAMVGLRYLLSRS